MKTETNLKIEIMKNSSYTNGTKLELKLVKLASKSWDSQFGKCYLETYQNENGELFSYKGTSPLSVPSDKMVKVKGTVKLNEWNGTTTVMLQRMAFVLTKQELQEQIERVQREAKEKNDALIAQTKQRDLEENERIAKKAIEREEFFIEVQKYVGKYVCYYGWSYDNSGQCSGIIKEIKKGTYENDLNIIVGFETEYTTQPHFTISWSSLKLAISQNGKYKSSRFSNWGTEIEIEL